VSVVGLVRRRQVVSGLHGKGIGAPFELHVGVPAKARDGPECRARLLWPRSNPGVAGALAEGSRDRLMVACQISSTTLRLQCLEPQ
jgi:hypothetical protein